MLKNAVTCIVKQLTTRAPRIQIRCYYWRCNFPVTPNVRRWLVGWSAGCSARPGREELHFHAPIGALILSVYRSLDYQFS